MDFSFQKQESLQNLPNDTQINDNSIEKSTKYETILKINPTKDIQTDHKLTLNLNESEENSEKTCKICSKKCQFPRQCFDCLEHFCFLCACKQIKSKKNQCPNKCHPYTWNIDLRENEEQKQLRQKEFNKLNTHNLYGLDSYILEILNARVVITEQQPIRRQNPNPNDLTQPVMILQSNTISFSNSPNVQLRPNNRMNTMSMSHSDEMPSQEISVGSFDSYEQNEIEQQQQQQPQVQRQEQNEEIQQQNQDRIYESVNIDEMDIGQSIQSVGQMKFNCNNVQTLA